MRRIISAIGIASLVLSASAKIEEAIDAALTDGIVMGTPFADGMVLQRGMKVPVWGKVNPGGKFVAAEGHGFLCRAEEVGDG